MKRKKPPMQPIVIGGTGGARFQENRLVRYLYDAASKHGVDLNHLVCVPGIPRGDFEQFYQLLGYSISGFGELRLVRDATKEKAEMKLFALADKAKAG